jgi:succinate dehydrogenase/fumarate reductase cytochrome b subunit
MALYIIIQLSRQIVGLEGSQSALSVMNVFLVPFLGLFFAFVLAYHACGGVVKMISLQMTPNGRSTLKLRHTFAGQRTSCIIFHMFSFEIRCCKLL